MESKKTEESKLSNFDIQRLVNRLRIAENRQSNRKRDIIGENSG